MGLFRTYPSPPPPPPHHDPGPVGILMRASTRRLLVAVHMKARLDCVVSLALLQGCQVVGWLGPLLQDVPCFRAVMLSQELAASLGSVEGTMRVLSALEV